MDNWSAASLNKDPLIEIHKKTTNNIIESINHFPRSCCTTSSCRIRRLLSIKHHFHEWTLIVRVELPIRRDFTEVKVNSEPSA